MLDDLQLGEFIYEQPAVGDIEYIFKHALTQEVSYNSVLMERRRLLHERIGAALESLYTNSIDDHLDELAHHYGRSGNSAKALDYLESAGLRAVRRWRTARRCGTWPPPWNYLNARHPAPSGTGANSRSKPALVPR